MLLQDYSIVPANDMPDRNKDQPLFGVSDKNFSSLKLWILHYLKVCYKSENLC